MNFFNKYIFSNIVGLMTSMIKLAHILEMLYKT